MKLPDAPEPVEIKRGAVEYHQEYPWMDSDSLYIWLGRNLASYLWTQCRWRRVLRREGISWKDFEKVISRGNFKWWVRGERQWKELIDSVTVRLERRLF